MNLLFSSIAPGNNQLFIVEFDLNDGPVLDGVHPPLLLLPAEAQNMSVDLVHDLAYLSNISFQFNSAFCALPDSIQFDQGSETHSFRIREQFSPVSDDNRPPNKDGFIYGFSHFIQRRDPSSKRGYHQV